MIFEIALGILFAYIIYLRFTREVIFDSDGKYLIRYFLWKPKSGDKYYLHHIVKSDHDRSEHCHPFDFESLIIWGGYYEVADKIQAITHDNGWSDYMEGEKIKWFGPGSILHRHAAWRHRLLLPPGKTAWTLVRRSPKIRDWGFYPNGKFCHNTKYNTKTGLCDD